jgi:hypothetical protein
MPLASFVVLGRVLIVVEALLVTVAVVAAVELDVATGRPQFCSTQYELPVVS